MGEFRQGLLPPRRASCLLEGEVVFAEGLDALEAPVDPAEEAAGCVEGPRGPHLVGPDRDVAVADSGGGDEYKAAGGELDDEVEVGQH